MVKLEFRVTEKSLSEDRQADPGSQEAGVLQETYFVMPVRLRVGDEEMLETETTERVFLGRPGRPDLLISGSQSRSPWMMLPLLSVAVLAPARLDEARRNGSSSYDLPGTGLRLLLLAKGDDICIESEVNGRRACASYAELRDEFDRFATEVRRVILRELPELGKHPYWGPWLAETIG